MKWLFVLFLSLLSVSAHADSALIAELSDRVTNRVDDAFDMERIEIVVKKENTNLFDYVKDRTIEEKISFYKSWLAEKAYQSLYDSYMQELKQASKTTGRKIKKRKSKLQNGAKKIFYLLDDKELKREYIREFDIDVVDYPDDYEEFSITVVDGNVSNKTRKGFNVVKDDKSKNESIYIQVNLNSNVDFDTFSDVDIKYKSNVMLGVTAYTSDYDKVVTYRKQQAEDLRQGMMQPYEEPCYNAPAKMCKKWKCRDEDCSGWPSSRIYIGEIYNFVQQHSLDYSTSVIADE